MEVGLSGVLHKVIKSMERKEDGGHGVPHAEQLQEEVQRAAPLGLDGGREAVHAGGQDEWVWMMELLI